MQDEFIIPDDVQTKPHPSIHQQTVLSLVNAVYDNCKEELIQKTATHKIQIVFSWFSGKIMDAFKSDNLLMSRMSKESLRLIVSVGSSFAVCGDIADQFDGAYAFSNNKFTLSIFILGSPKTVKYSKEDDSSDSEDQKSMNLHLNRMLFTSS